MSTEPNLWNALLAAVTARDIANETVIAAAQALIDAGKPMAAVCGPCGVTAPTLAKYLDDRTARIAQARNVLA